MSGADAASPFRPALVVDEWPQTALVPEAAPYSGSVHWAQHAPLLIDNGSAQLRAGFASAAKDTPQLVFDNIVSRFRDRKRAGNMLLCGNDCYVDSQSRAAIRSAFDADVLCGFDVMESMLDYTFSKLRIDTDRVDHPILLTETLCNPEYSRAQLNELLFEAYQAPSVNYGLDAMFSAYANGVREDGVVVSSGRATTYVVPITGGRGMLTNAKRLSWGGANATDFLHRLLQLKYPNFPQRITPYQTQAMMEELLYVSTDYDAEIRSLNNPDALAAIDRVVQLPHTPPERREKGQEELDRIAERKRAAGQRLMEQARQMRQEKTQQKENDLKYYEQLREWKDKEPHAQYLQRLEDEGFDSEPEFDKVFKRLEDAVRRNRAEQLGEELEEKVRQVAPHAPCSPLQKQPTFPLVDVPDAELDEEGVKEKRRQRLLKAGYEARMRARAEKEEEERLLREAEERDREEQRENPQAWLEKLRAKHSESMVRIHERKRLRELLPDRKSVAAQQRMKSITALASEQTTPNSSQRRRKRGDDEDTFGADDNDWAVYRAINNAVDSEEEQEEMAELDTIEQKLLEFDDAFTRDNTYAAKQALKTKLTNTFLRGYEPRWDPDDVAQYHQVHLNVERIRVPEVSWQPMIAGVDQAGIGELSRYVLRAFEDPVRDRMVRNVLVTGGYSQLPGFNTRLHSVLQSSLPQGTALSVRRAQNARLDPWRGMSQWVTEQEDVFRSTSLSRADYEEKGSGWFQEHALSACWQG
ncbi:Nuclear actin-protein involved in chromatin remodeling [Malassezia sp. CBS 17886]|nr:Nuclear actin-protein involved in chromatin remodeling [Malassezia sp. CBS 17886]